MFFLGKVTVAQLVIVDFFIFILVVAAFSRWRGGTGKLLRFRGVLLYFLQLFLLLLLAPLRPEGLIVHLLEYDSKAIHVIPVVQGKANHVKALKLGINIAGSKQFLNLNLLHFKDQSRDFVFDFGSKPDNFDITGVEIFTSFFTHPLTVIKVPGHAAGIFFHVLNEQPKKVGRPEDLHTRLNNAGKPPALLFQLTDAPARYVVWHALVQRALLWSLLAACIFGSLVLTLQTSKLALRHAIRAECNTRSALAYYYWSALVICFSFGIFIFMAEYATRFYFRDVLSTSSGVNYFYNKSYKLFVKERNSHKFRGKEFGIKKNKEFRIVVIGDSITYGQGVYPYTARYSDLIEKRMNTALSNQGVEVINLGVCGQDLPQHIRMLPLVKNLRPDFVLYQWFINDMDFMGQVAEIKAPRLLNNRYLHTKLLDNSALYYLLQSGWRRLLIHRGVIKEYDRHVIDLFADDNSLATKNSNARLLQLLDGIKGLGVPYGVVLFPHAAYPINEYPFAFMHERIKKICANRDIPCLDLRKAYSPFDDRLEKLWANRLDPHPSALANDIAAGELVDFFGSDWRQKTIELPRTKPVGR